jgi:holliday junction DNA helicase RuvA
MISHLKGKLEHTDKNHIIIDVRDVGYHVNIPSSTLSRLPKIGDELKLFIYQVVREDDLSLFGFISKEERSLFALLLSVSGIGPKASLKIISSFPIDKLVAAIASGDAEMITSVPGIGSKTAQKLVIELKEKIAKTYAIKPSDMAVGIKGDVPTVSDAISALIALGYSPKEARNTILQSGLDLSTMSVEDIVKQALKRLL